MKSVEVPDSLITPEIEKIRVVQQKIIVHAKIFNSCGAEDIFDENMAQFQLVKMLSAMQSAIEIGKLVQEFVVHNNGRSDISILLSMLSTDLLNVNKAQEAFKQRLALSVGKLQEKGKGYFVTNMKEITTSKEFLNYMDIENSYIRHSFEFLNVIQLCYAYNIKLKDLDSIKTGGSQQMELQIQQTINLIPQTTKQQQWRHTI